MRWLVLILLLSGCAAIDKERLTRIQPNTNGTYSVRVFVNTDYSLDGENSEQQRLDWVTYRMEKSRVCPNGFTIEDRQVIDGGSNLLDKSYEIFYTTRCT